MKASDLVSQLRQLGDPAIAAHSQGFFKTGQGEYGEGDRFLGIRVPKIRALVKHAKTLSMSESLKLLRSSYHEARLLALLILVERFQRGDDAIQNRIYRHYLEQTRYINNWDLVDSSAHKIVGAYLCSREKSVLYRLAESESLWERRIAVMATLYFIREQSYADTLALCEALLHDPEDLIHKATGWMLREVGNRDGETERRFLKRHYRRMPRTMLRYAIEKFPQHERKLYLSGEIL
jgi:3-methyladenine DNA glycosylase AlkD